MIMETGSFRVNPWKISPATRVEEVKKMIRLLPIWAITIIFWTTSAQMIAFSVEQSNHHGENNRAFPNSSWFTYRLLWGSHIDRFSCI
ncbi:hypothetical protein DITRI_Ditri10aG0128600 [Diplodiscus trichospermus]